MCNQYIMEYILGKIILGLFIGVTIYCIYNYFVQNYLQTHQDCTIENYDIDDLVVIKRTPEYSGLINNMIDQKNFIFSDEQIKVLKNSQQIYNVSNDQQNISNISDVVYTNCNNQLGYTNPNFNDFNDLNNDDNIIDISNNEYDEIKNMLENDINKFIKPNSYNTKVLTDIPNVKNYLKNYYQDMYGNKIDATLKDYFIAYYTLMNNDDNVGLPVNTLIGQSNFIIPDQYKTDSHFTNAYNIDWNRIINPIGYSM